ncbi:MAG: cell division protein FtsZ, partial [Gemmatimonadota bacterium]
RAMEAAQEAISSPLLDNISIQGAAGVLINITGGMDLAIDEVTTISQIIQDAAGEDAEIIFGAVHDPSMKEEVRVTVIATGFDKEAEVAGVIRPNFGAGRRPEMGAQGQAQGYPQPQKARAVAGGGPTGPIERSPAPHSTHSRMPTDLEIPTFIRRQMD